MGNDRPTMDEIEGERRLEREELKLPWKEVGPALVDKIKSLEKWDRNLNEEGVMHLIRIQFFGGVDSPYYKAFLPRNEEYNKMLELADIRWQEENMWKERTEEKPYGTIESLAGNDMYG